MKKNLLLLLTVFTVNITFGQQIEKIDYCNCQDKIDQIAPTLNGKYERICNGILIEKGEFINDSKSGNWTTYSRTGKLIRKLNYDNGLLDGKVELFYLNGKPKFTGQFRKGEKIDQWTYYTENGNIIAQGNYDQNRPTGIWTIFDIKGKKPTVQYDYDSNKYILQKQSPIHKQKDVIQNENTEEWYILIMPKVNYFTKTEPLGGYNFANYMYIELLEVPENFWDTYLYYKRTISYSISADNKVIFQNQLFKNKFSENQPEYIFLINTNPPEKLKKIEYSDLQIKLLNFKINETLSLMPPWVFEGQSEINVLLHYVINKNLI